jgi:hypothetical protein
MAKELQTDQKLADMIMSQLAIAGVTVVVRPEPTVGWNATAIAPSTDKLAMIQLMVDVITARLRERLDLKP